MRAHSARDGRLGAATTGRWRRPHPDYLSARRAMRPPTPSRATWAGCGGWQASPCGHPRFCHPLLHARVGNKNPESPAGLRGGATATQQPAPPATRTVSRDDASTLRAVDDLLAVGLYRRLRHRTGSATSCGSRARHERSAIPPVGTRTLSRRPRELYERGQGIVKSTGRSTGASDTGRGVFPRRPRRCGVLHGCGRFSTPHNPVSAPGLRLVKARLTAWQTTTSRSRSAGSRRPCPPS